MTPEEVIKRCDENTIGVVPTLGVTYTLQYEPVQAVSIALDDLEEERGLDIPIHVDAASGGFIAPFIHPSVVWDFRLPRVQSVNVSGHKFGLAPLGCGWAIWREARDLPEELIFRVKYLGGNMPTFALNFSRPGGQITAQYYNFVRLGREKLHLGSLVSPYLPNGPINIADPAISGLQMRSRSVFHSCKRASIVLARFSKGFGEILGQVSR